MDRKVSQRAMSRLAGTLVMFWVVVFCFFASPTFGYTTKSPKVVKMVNKAVAYLKRSSHDKPGGWALIGLTLLKNKEPLNDPKLMEAAERVAEASRNGAGGMDIYSNGLCLIFLTSYDHGKYRPEILQLMKALEEKQKDHGGWGYPKSSDGDTSMTQYGVLGTWEAKQKGFEISQKVVDKVATWLLKTQDPSGAWGYQGIVPDSGALVKQREIRHSLAAAGLGSVYICADLLGMTPKAHKDRKNPELKEVTEGKSKEKEEEREKVKTSINREKIRAAMARGNGWFNVNANKPVAQEVYYYMYALERYQSFRDLAEGKGQRDWEKEEGPDWYNKGVDFLMKEQKQNGTWDCEGQCKEVVNTAFGALFLLRSTAQSIGKIDGFGDGNLIGGRGLPKEGEEFLGSDGRVVKKSPLGPFAAMNAALNRQDAADLRDSVDRLEREMKGKGSDLLTSEHQRLFQKLLSDPSPEKRVAAIKGLILSGNLDHIPTLIRALGDKDDEVVITARDGLRRMTRRIGGFGLPDDSTPDERRIAAEKWKAWYLSIHPDQEF